MQIQLAVKKIDGRYETALFVDGKFTRSGQAMLVGGAFDALVSPLLSVEHVDGTDIVVTVVVLTPAEQAALAAQQGK